jgi:predicted  nucleic acid-binding Zn-ribbon protein
VAKVVHKCCNCGKTLKLKNVDSKCAKCANVSFSHLHGQLVKEDVVSHVFAPVGNVSDDVSNCEVVPLKVFARAGKRGHYESYGLCFIDSDT